MIASRPVLPFDTTRTCHDRASIWESFGPHSHVRVQGFALFALAGFLLAAGIVWSAETGKSGDTTTGQGTGTGTSSTNADEAKRSGTPKGQSTGDTPTGQGRPPETSPKIADEAKRSGSPKDPSTGDTSLTGGTFDADLEKVGKVLMVFLVLSVVFEVAMSTIFNSRFFIARWDGKGAKTPIMILLGFLLFWGYCLDIVRDLLVALGRPEGPARLGGQILSALLITGGSSGVLEVFRKLRIREPREERQKRVSEIQAAFASQQQKK